MKTSKLCLSIDSVLWQDKRWSIELLAGRKELAVTDGNRVCYAYFDRDAQILRWDHVWAPPYVRRKALERANKSGMISIYCD